MKSTPTHSPKFRLANLTKILQKAAGQMILPATRTPPMDLLRRKLVAMMMTLASLHQRKLKQKPFMKLAENPLIQKTKTGVIASAISSVDALIWSL